MKTLKLILFVLIVIGSNPLHAKVFRVNNNTTIDAPYVSFTSALNSASNFDTIYLEGSVTAYGNLILTKPVVVMGTGYFLQDNPQTQADYIQSTVGNIIFENGSSGSIIMGLVVTGIIEIKVGDIIIKRNHLNDIGINSSVSFGNILITQNFIKNIPSDYSDNTARIYNTTGSSTIYNVMISNNIILSNYTDRNHDTRIGDISLGTNYSGIISNNILHLNVNVSNFSNINNIMTCCTMFLNNNTYFNNIGNATQFPIVNNNLQNIDPVFIGGSSPDGGYQLDATSPAINYGNDGTDCGAFGGLTPYVLSGMPDIPSIFEINMPAMGTSTEGIDVTVKAKVHK